VPPGFDTRLREAGISGMNVLWFMRDEAGGFLPASRWPAACAALTTTHDLPTLAGWWEGHDLAQRTGRGCRPTPTWAHRPAACRAACVRPARRRCALNPRPAAWRS
jgi:4-alpha-glucanotransferase